MSQAQHKNPRFCLESLSATGCPRGDSCSLNHRIIRCTCGKVVGNGPGGGLKKHQQGRPHAIAMEALEQASSRAPARAERVLHARNSASTSSSNVAISAHERSSDRPPSQNTAASAILARCQKCGKKYPVSEMSEHNDMHDRQRRMQDVNESSALDSQNKFGIEVGMKDGIDFGIVEGPKTISVEITKVDPKAKVVLAALGLARSDPLQSQRFSLKLVGTQTGTWIPYRSPQVLEITCTPDPEDEGLYEDVLELIFFDKSISPPAGFPITRSLKVNVGSQADHTVLQPTSPYVGKRRKYVPFTGEIKFSTRPLTWTKNNWKDNMPQYNVPNIIAESTSSPHAHAIVKGILPNDLNMTTYGAYFQVLAHVEEEEQKVALDAYSMEDVLLTAADRGHRYELEVLGLSEGRPSVLVGDYILVKHTDSSDTVWHRGCVQHVYEMRVSIQFDEKFSVYKGNKFDVRFVLNRVPFRRMHHALANKNNQARLLFPSAIHLRSAGRTTMQQRASVNTINRNIGEDEEQLEAVTAILNLPPGSPPFVVFGPPGTGKTVTVVETIRQILKKDEHARILVCAPSNSAADLLALRLSVEGRGTVLRLNALSRKFDSLPELLRPFSIYNDHRVFAMPASAEDLMAYRIVVSTCITGGVPASLGVDRGFYTHIFIDEAGQAKEPEVMIPIKGLASNETNIILAGDPKQLGPIVRSRVANVLGLSTSYLLRLMGRAIYDVDSVPDTPPVGGRGICVVKLVKNFRTHPDILRFSNQHFYHGELQAVGNEGITRSLENWDELPKKRFPLIFHSIIGKDQREGSSPSFFNIEEATQVKKYCLLLIDNRKNHIKAEQIIVIAPYHAQVMKLRQLFRQDQKLRNISVGSVEEFQGQESRVVILTTTRSSESFLTSDIRGSLGFVASPARLNVALTRAQALLIVVGNPLVLGLDPLWRSFIDFVHSHGGWKGRALNWNAQPQGLAEQELREREDMLTRLQSLIASASYPEIDSDDDDDEVLDWVRGHEDVAIPRRDD